MTTILVVIAIVLGIAMVGVLGFTAWCLRGLWRFSSSDPVAPIPARPQQEARPSRAVDSSPPGSAQSGPGA